MLIRHYIPSDAPAVLQLWDTAGVRAGYAPQDEAGLRALLLAHSDFSAAHTFVLDVDGQAQGFINGCTGAHLAQGAVRGYVGALTGIITDIQKELGGSARVVATGGMGRMMAEYCPLIDEVDPNLTLEGLRLIYENNKDAFRGRRLADNIGNIEVTEEG